MTPPAMTSCASFGEDAAGRQHRPAYWTDWRSGLGAPSATRALSAAAGCSTAGHLGADGRGRIAEEAGTAALPCTRALGGGDGQFIRIGRCSGHSDGLPASCDGPRDTSPDYQGHADRLLAHLLTYIVAGVLERRADTT